MPGTGPDPLRPPAAAALAARPDAARWARDCAWVPGTGYCPVRACGERCVFRAQREAEAGRIVRARRRRRQHPARMAAVAPAMPASADQARLPDPR